MAALKLGELIGVREVLLDMRADTKRAALGGVAARLAERAGRSHDAMLSALLLRERLGSTSVGEGVAIPHASVHEISAPAAVLAMLERPVAFGAPEDDQVDVLLALVWPASDRKGLVAALLHVSRILRSAGLPNLLRKSATPEEAHAWIGTYEDWSGRPGGGSSGPAHGHAA